MKRICVYTCITGNYDNLHEIEHPEKNIDYYCFTNNKNLRSKTWQIIQIKNQNLDNVRLARKIKILGHPIINQYETAVWTDADVIWQQPISEFVKTFFKTAPLAIFKHHARSNIRDEAIACLTLRKDSKNSILKTLDYYHHTGYPDNNGLCETTVFIKNPNDPQIIKTMQIWFNIVEKYSRRDQLSFNFAIWQANLKINLIKLNVWDNNWFYTVRHIPNPEIKDCHVYYGNPNHNFNFDKYFIYTYRHTNNFYTFSTTIPHNTTQIELCPANTIGYYYQNLTIFPHPTSIKIHGFATYNHQNVICTGRSTIKLSGNFKQGQKLSFSIDLNPTDPAIIDSLIETQWFKNDTLTLKQKQLEIANHNLQTEIRNLQTELQSILNSKGWQTLEKTRKLIFPFKSRK